MKLLPSLFDPSQHLAEGEIVKFDSCPVCGECNSKGRKEVGVLQQDPIISLSKCQNCKAVSASHKPKQDVLAEYYNNHFSQHYEHFNKDGDSDVTFSDVERFSRHLHGMLSALIDEYLSGETRVVILDFGGGDGTLAFEYAKTLSEALTIEIIVVDYGENICKSNKLNINLSKVESIEKVACQADIVIASASLEHIPDLQGIQNKLWHLLNKGGFYYARTPYVIPLRKYLPVEFGFPAHIHDLGSDFWNSLPDSFGVEVDYIYSRPSIVEVSFRRNPVRYFVAFLLKLPGHFLARLSPFKQKEYLWPFVGGWEVLLRKT